ncbi:hypothetical protein [Bacillus halotolerans]|uniref:hypothetical protein n=1 Tax=Bacillus halotolerans TaxID=260554 RepID=UPI0003A8947D|nr:hypothetical protein [Bacillus halotolerans]UYO33814.1 hypothetical protein NDR85_09780 [Bacillus halotolerans]
MKIMYASEIVKQKETELWNPYRAGTFIGEIRLLEGYGTSLTRKRKKHVCYLRRRQQTK